MSSCFSQPWSDSLIALGVQLGLGVPFCRWLQLFGSASDMWLSFVWWPISFSVDGLDALADVCIFCNYGCPYITIIYHQLPSITIINHISFSVCRSFATLLPRYGKRTTRWIVSSAFFNPVPRIVPPSWTKSERLQRGVSQGIFPEMGVILPSGYLT